MVRVISAAMCALLVPSLAGAQSSAGTEAWRTPWGDPDLQGTWTNTTTTPLQRPAQFADRALLTEEEVAELNARRRQGSDRRPQRGDTGAYNSFWLDSGERTLRTSLITEPADGRIPPVTDRVAAKDKFFSDTRLPDAGPLDSYEQLNLYDRCITRGLPGGMLPGFYNHNYQILQTADYVVILVEMIHDARIIPLDGRAHLPSRIGQWLGDSRARWEGDTLVVETTNFAAKADERAISSRAGLPLVLGGGENLRLVERFTRVAADAIDYQFTVTDPTTYVSQWSASVPMSALEAPLFEYACHEGNYGLPNILRGSRNQDPDR